jgi:hypothetical protein
MEEDNPDEMEHHSQWYDSNGTLKGKYNLELVIYEVINAFCNIHKDEQDPCIKLIKFIVDKDIFFKLYDNKSIFQLLLNIPNRIASLFYNVKCGWGFGNLTRDLFKMSDCLLQLSEGTILDETKNIELIKKFEISGILDYINMEDPIIKEMLDNGTNGNDITLEKLFSYKAKNSEGDEQKIFENMSVFVSNMRDQIKSNTLITDINDNNQHVTDRVSIIHSSKKYAEPTKPRKTVFSWITKSIKRLGPMKPKKRSPPAGGNYKRNSSRKSTSRRNVKSLRVKKTHCMVKSYKRKNYKRIK